MPLLVNVTKPKPLPDITEQPIARMRCHLQVGKPHNQNLGMKVGPQDGKIFVIETMKAKVTKNALA